MTPHLYEPLYKYGILPTSSQHFGAWRQAPQPSSLVNIPAGIKLAYDDGFSRLEACKMRFRRNQKEHWWVVNLIDQGKFQQPFNERQAKR